MKVMIDRHPQRGQLVGWCKAVGIEVVSRQEAGLTHYVTAAPGSMKAKFAEQAGARIISHQALLTIIRERANSPNRVAPPRYRQPQPQVIVAQPVIVQAGPVQVAPPPPSRPAPPPRATNLARDGKRAIFLDDLPDE